MSDKSARESGNKVHMMMFQELIIMKTSLIKSINIPWCIESNKIRKSYTVDLIAIKLPSIMSFVM